MCVFFALSLLLCRFRLLWSLAAAFSSLCCGCLFSLLVVVVGRRCLFVSFVVVVAPLSLSSWSACPPSCRRRWSLSLSWPLDLGISTCNLPSLEKAMQRPLWRETCPRGHDYPSNHTTRFRQMPYVAPRAQEAQLILVVLFFIFCNLFSSRARRFRLALKASSLSARWR